MSPLCEVADVKAWAGVTGAADDGLLLALVEGMSAAVESMLNRTFAVATYTETRNGTGKPTMMVRNDPIVSVASVTVDGIAIAPRTGPTAGSGHVFDTDTIYLAGTCFTRGVQNVVLSYEGGYATIPADIVQATTEACAFLYNERTRIGLASKAMAGETTAYLRDLPPHLMRRFQQYARVVVPA
jgi:hypothetical protein